MSNPITDHLRKQAADLLVTADAIDELYARERNAARVCVRLAEIAQKAELVYGEDIIVRSVLEQ
jgi:hypothetical protein